MASTFQFEQRAPDERVRHRHLVAVVFQRLRSARIRSAACDTVASSSVLPSRKSFGGLDLMRHGRDAAERDARLVQFSVHDVRRRGATDQRPVERVLVAGLQIGAAVARGRNFHAQNQVAGVQRIVRESCQCHAFW